MLGGESDYVVLLHGVCVEEETRHPGVDRTLELLVVGIVTVDILIQVIRSALNKVRNILIILQIYMHQIIGQRLVVHSLREQEPDLGLLWQRRLLTPHYRQRLLLIDLQLLDHIMISLPQLVGDIGPEHVLMQTDLDLAGVVGGELGGGELADGPHCLVVVVKEGEVYGDLAGFDGLRGHVVLGSGGYFECVDLVK